MATWKMLAGVLEVVDVLEELEIPYHVGGSLASSVHGVPRQTNDLDLVVDLNQATAAILVLRLRDRFYIDGEMIRRAIRSRSSFNLVHLATGSRSTSSSTGEAHSTAWSSPVTAAIGQRTWTAIW